MESRFDQDVVKRDETGVDVTGWMSYRGSAKGVGQTTTEKTVKQHMLIEVGSVVL